MLKCLNYFQAPKGKQGTKGQKQILQENAETLAFYRNMILVSSGVYALVAFFLLKSIPSSLVDTVSRILMYTIGPNFFEF